MNGGSVILRKENHITLRTVEGEIVNYIVGKEIGAKNFDENKFRELCKEADIYLLLDRVKKSKCLPFLKKYSIYFEEYQKYIIDKELKELHEKNQNLWKQYTLIVQEAKKNNIKLIEPKGFSLSIKIYQSIMGRQISDVDFLVNKENLITMGILLVENGFFHRHDGSIEDICKALLKKSSDYFYEVKFYKKYMNDRYHCIELKNATSAIKEKDINEFKNNLQMIEYEGEKIYTFSDEYLLLHLCVTLYNNAYSYEGCLNMEYKWRDYIDLYNFLEKAKHINWNKFNELILKYNYIDVIFYIKTVFNIMWKKEILNKVVLDFYDSQKVAEINSFIQAGDNRKEFFLNQIFTNQEIFNKRNLENNHIDYMNNYFQIYRSNQIIHLKMHLKKEYVEGIRQGNRLYIFFIYENKEIDGESNADAIYKENKTLLLYYYKNDFYILKEQMKYFTVNYQNVNNKNLHGIKIKDKIKSNKEFVDIELNCEDLLKEMNKKCYINMVTDISVLPNYYKHQEYYTVPGKQLIHI